MLERIRLALRRPWVAHRIVRRADEGAVSGTALATARAETDVLRARIDALHRLDSEISLMRLPEAHHDAHHGA